MSAIMVLMEYLTDTAVAPLQRDFVEVAEPFCSQVALIPVLGGRPEMSTLSRAYTKYTFVLPSPSQSTLKMLILRPLLKIAIHHKRLFLKSCGSSPPSSQRTLCTLVKMKTIMDDPLVRHQMMSISLWTALPRSHLLSPILLITISLKRPLPKQCCTKENAPNELHLNE